MKNSDIVSPRSPHSQGSGPKKAIIFENYLSHYEQYNQFEPSKAFNLQNLESLQKSNVPQPREIHVVVIPMEDNKPPYAMKIQIQGNKHPDFIYSKPKHVWLFLLCFL
jgi:hypothetical protein